MMNKVFENAPSVRGCLSVFYTFFVLSATASANERVNDVLRSQILAVPPQVKVAITNAASEFLATASMNAWISNASQRLRLWIADDGVRMSLIRAVYRESMRAHLDPDLLLALIQVESAFRQSAISPKGAIGFMQVMPFWVKAIGRDGHDLFDTSLNLRYGTVILRHYLERERGDLMRALARYKGTPERDDYAKVVVDTWRQWRKPDAPAPREPVRMARVE